MLSMIERTLLGKKLNISITTFNPFLVRADKYFLLLSFLKLQILLI